MIVGKAVFDHDIPSIVIASFPQPLDEIVADNMWPGCARPGGNLTGFTSMSVEES
jgi:hypothetical protein